MADLEVRRPTLEDTYLHMVHREDGAGGGDGARAGAGVRGAGGAEASGGAKTPSGAPAPGRGLPAQRPRTQRPPVGRRGSSKHEGDRSDDFDRSGRGDGHAPGEDTAGRAATAGATAGTGWRRRRYWRAGLLRGGIELRHLVRSPKELSGHLVNVVVALLLAGYISDQVPGTRVPMAHLTLAGFAAYLLFQIGLVNLPQILVTEREEGALLRLRATPGGIPAYLVAKSLLVVAMAFGTLAVLLGAAAVLVDGPLPHGPGGWLTLLWVSALGLLAVVPLGAAIGAVLPNPVRRLR